MSLHRLRFRCVRLYFFVVNVVGTLTAANVFYRCRDNPIQYTSTFAFNCSNESEVIYVESAVIGFTPMYKADKGVYQCPITLDTCTKTTSVPSTLCDGHTQCELAQRILLYNESGLQCSINGTKAASGNLGGNLIYVNYSCISRDLCIPVPGYNGRYTCSTAGTIINSFSSTTPTRATNSSDNVTTIETGTHQYMQLSLSPVIVNGYSLSAGAIIGIVIGSVIITVLVIGITIGLLHRGRKKRQNDMCKKPERLAMSLQKSCNEVNNSVSNPNNNINSDLTAYDQAAPVVSHAKTATWEITTPESKGNDNSRQRSVYEMAGTVINYDTVRNSSVPVNESCSGGKTATNAIQQNNPDTPAAYSIVMKNNRQVTVGTTLKNDPLPPTKKIGDNAAEGEYAEVRCAVINVSSPSPRRNNSEINYYNCTAEGTKEKVSTEIVASAAKDHEDGGYVDWAPAETDCAYGEVTVVDNALYADERLV